MPFAIPAILAASGSLAGCNPPRVPPELPPPLMDDRPMMPADAKTTSDPKQYVLIVRIRMLSIEVPVGTASGSEELWSYLDEEQAQASQAAGLGLNGFRVGLGGPDSWADVVKVLRRLTGRQLKEATMMGLPGKPAQIVLKSDQPVQTIFMFYSDRTLSGADYPPGDNLLTIACTLDEDDPSTVVMTALPQVRSARRKPNFVMGSTGLMMARKPAVRSFYPLTFRITVPRKSFVVIGPGPASGRPTSVGHHFLLSSKEGMLFETVLVLMPKVWAAPASPGQPVRAR